MTKSVDTPHLRSVVLAGHAGAGKTTLAEALLFRTGSINRQGRVEDGTATLDFEPEEQKRHMSLSLAVASLDDDGNLVTLVDTPGYPDFVAEVVSGFRAVDAALICVDATGGVEAGTENAVALGRANRTAALFVVNKCDRENAEPSGVLDALREAFGTKIAPLQLAIGKADSFSGYVDLVHRRAFRWDGKQEVEIPIPADMEAEVAMRRDQLLEAASEADDDVLTKYLEGEEISDAELDACLHRGVRDSLLAPVLVASATKGSACAASSTRSCATCRRRPRSADGRPRAEVGRSARGRAQRRRSAPRPRLQDHRRPVRRSPHLPARPVRHAPQPGPRLERGEG